MIADTVVGSRYMRHISERRRVGTSGCRFGSGGGLAEDVDASVRRSSACRL
jgi:hypothetical protein